MKNPTDTIHYSWEPIKRLLYQEPLNELRNEILPSTLYYPRKEDLFRAFSKPLSDIKVVILGQDPYHGPGQANGLAFAVNENISTPPSLRIIAQEVKELHTSPEWKTLKHWESQGVLLLNTALTVEAGKPGSHLEYWRDFTKRVVYFISKENPCIWLLWGAKAQLYQANIVEAFQVDRYSLDNIKDIPIHPDYNYVLKAAHPAAEVYKADAGFIGCGHFEKANAILAKQKEQRIIW